MTENMIRAQAAEAEREADAIFTKIWAARNGSDALCPAGFERELERASDLKRRARVLTAEADELRAETLPVEPPPSPLPAPVAKVLEAAPTKPAAPAETAETVAARILSSDFAAPVTALAPQGLGAGAADTVEAVVVRILRA